ncbi:MAG: flagellar motor switch protein FliG [Caldilineaceae bacterium]|nr:flagellar motor switch protein FliG [Caldilineaceae bacterium]
MKNGNTPNAGGSAPGLLTMTKLAPLTDGERNAAIILVALGAQLSANVMRHIPDPLVERLTYAMSTMNRVVPEVRLSLTQEFIEELETHRRFNYGGIEYAREVLSKAVGRERAEELLSRVTYRDSKRPFDFLADVEPVQVARFLQEEHPQTISLILAHLPPTLSSRVFTALPDTIRTEVVNRIGMMDRISPDVVKVVEDGLQSKLSLVLPRQQQGESIGGIDFLVQLLNQVDRTTEKALMSELAEINPDLAEQVQSRMFVFEDLTLLDNRSLELVLRDVDKKDLLLAMRGAPESVRTLIFRNMSKRAAQMMQEDLAVMGPVRLRTVEEAQKNIVKIVRRLEEEEQIVISRGNSEDVLI